MADRPHARSAPPGPRDAGPLFFPGHSQPDGFDCAHEGRAWLLGIGPAGEASAEPARTGALRFIDTEMAIGSAADLEAFERTFSTAEAGSLLVRARLSGRAPRELIAGSARSGDD